MGRFRHTRRGFDFYEPVSAIHGDPEILSSWEDHFTGDLIVLALFPGDGPRKDDPNKIKLTEVRIPQKTLSWNSL